MAEALVSFLVEQLGSFTFQHVEQHVKLVVNVEEEVATLTLNLKTIEAVLADAERRQVKENSVRRWLSNLKEVSYKIDDVVDEWSTEILKQQIENQGDNAIVPKKKSGRRQIKLQAVSFLSSLQIVAVIRTLQTLPDFLGVTLELLPPLGTLPFLEALEIEVNDNDIAIPTGPD